MKRMILLVIVISLLLGIGTFPVNAEQNLSGSCGENLTWEYDSAAKTLIISGKGEMKTYSYANVPWWGIKEEVEHLVIEKGVSSVSYYAFSGFLSITELTLPSTMRTLGHGAFYGASSLESVKLNEGLRSMGDKCFGGSAVKSITLPSTLESIGVDCFGDEVIDIFVKSGNEHFCSRGGILFSKDQTALYEYGAKRTAASYYIPDTVDTIMPAAFSRCVYLENVVFPRGLVNIGYEAFEGSAIYNNEANWEDGVLYHNGALLAVERWKGGEIAVKDGTRIIAAYAFYQSDKYNSAAGMFRSITLPNSLVAIGDAAFANSSVERLVIPKSVTKFGRYAFNYLHCRALVFLRGDVYLSSDMLGVQDKNLSNYERFEAGEFNGAIGGAWDSEVHRSAAAYGYDFYPMGFTDVTSRDWYYPAVEYVTENRVLEGTGAKSFSPDETMTRAMLITALWRIDGSTKVRVKDIPYTDIKDDYYTYAVHWAHKHGITNGTTETTFSPNDTVTREQAVTILYRYAVYKEYDVSGEADLTGFPDADKLSGYARDGMNWACDKEIIKGSNDYGVDYLDPQGGTTRAQLAMILKRFMTL